MIYVGLGFLDRIYTHESVRQQWFLLGESVGGGLHTPGLAGPPEEVERQRTAQVEVEDGQNPDLHLQDVSLGVGPVGDVDEVLHLGSVDFFVLSSDQHRGHTHELELAATDLLDVMLEISVQDGHGGVESLLQQVELEVDTDQPVDEDSPHLGQNLGLISQVVCLHILDILHVPGGGRKRDREREITASGISLPQVVVDVVDVLNHQLRITSVLGIDILDLWVSLHGQNVHLSVGNVHGLNLLGFLDVGGILLLFGSSDQSRLQRLLERLSILQAIVPGVGDLKLSQSGPLQVGGSCRQKALLDII